MNSKLLLLLSAVPATVLGHGTLTLPRGREGVESFIEDGNAPVNINDWPLMNPEEHPENQSFVCGVANDDHTDRITDVTAGTALEMRWEMTAEHPGDGSIQLSYDYALRDRQKMKWFKIANLPQQQRNNDQNISVKLPSWLPAGKAVLRWDWYTTQDPPNVEYYTKCVDIEVTSNSDVTPDEIPSAEIKYEGTDPAAYPYMKCGRGCNDFCFDCATEDWAGTSKGKYFIHGPACVGGVEGNCCDLSNYVPVDFDLGSGNPGAGGGFEECSDFGSSGPLDWKDTGDDNGDGDDVVVDNGDDDVEVDNGDDDVEVDNGDDDVEVDNGDDDEGEAEEDSDNDDNDEAEDEDDAEGDVDNEADDEADAGSSMATADDNDEAPISSAASMLPQLSAILASVLVSWSLY